MRVTTPAIGRVPWRVSSTTAHGAPSTALATSGSGDEIKSSSRVGAPRRSSPESSRHSTWTGWASWTETLTDHLVTAAKAVEVAAG